MMERYAIYLRKSRADIELEAIEKMETLKRHKKILLELAYKKQIHVDDNDIYEEIVSGETIAARPQMQKLLKAVYQKTYRGVLVVEIERLARGDTRDQGEVAEAFKYSNTLIITPTKTYDPTNQFDEEYFEFGLFMSRREYKTIRRRLQTGLIEAVKDGNYVGSNPPYGYDKYAPDRKTKTLIKNDRSKYVVMMFELFVNEGLTAGQIAKRLNEIGAPTQTGGKWSRYSITDMLQNVTYTGQVVWNKRKSSKEYDGNGMIKHKRRNTPDQQFVVPGKHEPIISQALFDKAQMRFNHSPVRADQTMINPLAGILRCKKCGKVIRYQPYKNRSNTKPRFLHPESVDCSMKSAYADSVINAVCDALKTIADDFTVSVTDGDCTQSVDVLDTLQKELDSAIRRREEIMEYFEQKIYSVEEFVERRDKNNARIDLIKKQIDEEKQNVKDPDQVMNMAASFYELIDKLKDDSISAQIKNQFIKELVDHIDIDTVDNGRGNGASISLDVYLK